MEQCCGDDCHAARQSRRRSLFQPGRRGLGHQFQSVRSYGNIGAGWQSAKLVTIAIAALIKRLGNLHLLGIEHIKPEILLASLYPAKFHKVPFLLSLGLSTALLGWGPHRPISGRMSPVARGSGRTQRVWGVSTPPRSICRSNAGRAAVAAAERAAEEFRFDSQI